MITMTFTDKVTHNYEAAIGIFCKYSIIQNGVGVEVGVRNGDFSKPLLTHFRDLDMMLVDPYLPYVDVHTVWSAEKQNEVKESARKNLSKFGGRVRWVYETSVDAAYTDEYSVPVDFVYIDAEHTYEALSADMKAWYPNVRQGGLLCGHDYSMTPVKKAVTEFAAAIKAPVLHVYGETGAADSWFIYKE